MLFASTSYFMKGSFDTKMQEDHRLRTAQSFPRKPSCFVRKTGSYNTQCVSSSFAVITSSLLGDTGLS